MGPDAFDYDLPAAAIAQVPVEPRDSARLLVSLDDSCEVAHRRVADLAELLGPGDLLVVNDTRVLPARLRLRRPAIPRRAQASPARTAMAAAMIGSNHLVPPDVVRAANRSIDRWCSTIIRYGR